MIKSKEDFLNHQQALYEKGEALLLEMEEQDVKRKQRLVQTLAAFERMETALDHALQLLPPSTQQQHMEPIFSAIAKDLQIEDYKLLDRTILVDWHFEHMEQNEQVHVNRQQYEQWLDESERLDCGITSPSGDLIPIKMTPADYWADMDRSNMIADLKVYLTEVFNPITA